MLQLVISNMTSSAAVVLTPSQNYLPFIWWSCDAICSQLNAKNQLIKKKKKGNPASSPSANISGALSANISNCAPLPVCPDIKRAIPSASS